MTKDECRMTNGRCPLADVQRVLWVPAIGILAFGIRHLALIRHSSLVIRHSLALAP